MRCINGTIDQYIFRAKFNVTWMLIQTSMFIFNTSEIFVALNDHNWNIMKASWNTNKQHKPSKV